jgi:hypothetical protein
MSRTVFPLVQSIPGSDIWYCEAGETRLYLGIVRIDDGYRFVRAIASCYAEAAFEIGKHGDVVLITPLREVLENLAAGE